MLKSPSPPPRVLEPAPRPETLIGAGTKIEGNVYFKGQLRLEGTVVGNLHGENGEALAVIGPAGRVEGEIQASEIHIEGEVRGNLVASRRVRLGSRARVEGDVTYALLEVVEGASVSGRLVHQPAETRLLSPGGAETFG